VSTLSQTDDEKIAALEHRVASLEAIFAGASLLGKVLLWAAGIGGPIATIWASLHFSK